VEINSRLFRIGLDPGYLADPHPHRCAAKSLPHKKITSRPCVANGYATIAISTKIERSAFRSSMTLPKLQSPKHLRFPIFHQRVILSEVEGPAFRDTYEVRDIEPGRWPVPAALDSLWQRRFAGDHSIVGRAMSLGNEPYTVVGDAGKDFVSGPQADLWLPFQFDPASNDMNHFQVAGLLRPGVSMAQANAQLKVAAAQYHLDYPKVDPRQQFGVISLRDLIVGDVRQPCSSCSAQLAWCC
jgi:hypothetical protein